MADQYSYLDELSPAEVFQLLAKTAEKSRGQYLEKVHIIFPQTEPFKFVTLEIPDPYAGKEAAPAEQQEVFKFLVDSFKQMTGRGERYNFPGGDRKAVHEGIATLLLKSAREADEKIADEKGNQYLVVSRPIHAKEAEVVFKNLCFHATSTRVTGVRSPTGTGSRYLFHLKDDHKRKSSFLSIAAGDVFKNCRILKGFEIDGAVTFLPSEAQPGEITLKYFCRLLEAGPDLFGGSAAADKTGVRMLAAVVHWPEADEIEFLSLGGLRFFEQEQFVQRKARHVKFEYLDLKESTESLDRLAEAIKHAKPYVGYSLELRDTKHIGKNTLERLNEQKARIEYNIAYLQSIAAPQPVLMRFSQKQLPALAAEISSFPMQVIYDGGIKYGFQATDKEPAGYHFILIDPGEAARIELDPFPLWQDLGVTHMRFRLDPFWARHYFESSGKGGAMVFVPEGSALYPPLHGWDRGSMNQYLRDTIRFWFHTELEESTIPERPIYIFDGQVQPKASIRVFLLDQDKMEPLHTRLGWLNDNLIIHQALEKEGLIKEMARDITWRKLAQKIKTDVENTRKDFVETAAAASHHMADTTAEMTQVLTAEINRVVKQTFRMVEKIRKMDLRLREWDEICADMEKTLKEVQQQRQKTTYQKGEAKNEFWRIEQEIQRELAVSDKRRKEIEEQLEEAIKKMQITARRLKNRLKGVKL